jgi:subtilase family serine protease
MPASLSRLAGIGALALFLGGSVLAGADDESAPQFRLKPGASTTASPTGYSPAQMLHAYGFDDPAVNSQVGAGQIIAIIDAYGSPTIRSDLAVFSQQYNLPAPTASNFIVATPQGTPKTNPGWGLETSLDVEWAHAIAPGATILLVESASASNSDLLAAVDYAVKQGAKVVSMSWGSNETRSEATSDFHFNVPGVTFFASSGDNGSGVIWPAASPLCVAVGGTTLKLDASGNVLGETGWSGSGGGTSSYESLPVFQSSLGLKGRGVPDVAYNADPATGVSVYDTTKYSGGSGWWVVGGTSAGAPQWAALVARVNGARQSSLTQTLKDVYGLGAGNFTDITSGSNGGFSCAAGWDAVTGLGSPIDSKLAVALQSGQ